MSELSEPVPAWLRTVADGPETRRSPDGSPLLSRVAKAVRGARPAAVLVLLGGPVEPDPLRPGGLPATADILLTERSRDLRQHAGQVAFPGGGSEPADTDRVSTALREAAEETGLDPAGVQVVRVLESLYVPPSRFDVTPVVGYWRVPGPVRVVDPAEARRVARVPLSTLLDPANRFVVRHPLGYRGPAFRVDDMIVWGFTGGILAWLFEMSGWEREWDRNDVRDLRAVLAEAGMTSTLPTFPPADPAAQGTLGDGDGR